MILLSVLIQFVFIDAHPYDNEVRSTMKPLRFTEISTNIEYIFQDRQNDYFLYELRWKNGTNADQIRRANALVEKYLQKSFETPDKSYPHVVEVCGSTVLAFFSRNTSISLNNINALLLARLQPYDNSNYICFLSVLKQHRQRDLATQLLNQFIKRSISLSRSRVTLHVNTKNTNALSLYQKCGMRCIDLVRNYYLGDPTYATQDAFFMALQLKNVKNSAALCRSSSAIDISFQDELLQKQICKIL